MKKQDKCSSVPYMFAIAGLLILISGPRWVTLIAHWLAK
jgi:hypothetical protein